MTGFALWTGCIHLLKCIKWKSSSICINLGPRLRGFGEVMLFIHHEVVVFFTVTLWPPMGTKHTRAHAIQAYCMCRVDAVSGKVSLSPCTYLICACTVFILMWSCMDCVSMMMSMFRKDIIPGQNLQTLVIFFFPRFQVFVQFVGENGKFFTERNGVYEIFPRPLLSYPAWKWVWL